MCLYLAVSCSCSFVQVDNNWSKTIGSCDRKVVLNRATLSIGEFTISCSFGTERRHLHNKHTDKTLRIIDLALTIQCLPLSKAIF